MLSWEMIAEADFHGDETLTDMQENIREALAEGGDPGPAVALALIHEVTARKNLQTELRKVATYVIDLETRLVQSKVRFAQAERGILD